jgi:RHS repeat-associated protein
MLRSRRMNLLAVLSVVINLLFNTVPLTSANANSPVKAAPPTKITKSSSLDALLKRTQPPISIANSQPLAAVPLPTISDKSSEISNSPTTSRSFIPSNPQDIVYLVNSRQIGRTRNFSVGSPNWTPVTGTITNGIVITRILDFILDPQHPYDTAWAVGDTGIWRTTNLDDDSPNWTQVRSMAQITASLQGPLPSTLRGVTRISGDASRPGYFFVVVGFEAASGKNSWVGWTSDNGANWSWGRLPAGLGVLQEGWTPTSLAVSQDGSGQIWIGASYSPNPPAIDYLIYSNDYGQNWQVVWHGPRPASQIPNPSSLYYSEGVLFATIGISIGRSFDKGATWAYAQGVPEASHHLSYGYTGFPQTNQLVYYVAQNGSLQYSVNGGISFITQTTTVFSDSLGRSTSDVSAIVNWLDRPNQLAWGLLLNSGNSSTSILKLSQDNGGTWSNKTGDWYSVFGTWFGPPQVGTGTAYGTTFIRVPSQVAYLRDLYLKGKLCDCNLAATGGTHNFANDPIDTSNGNLSYQVKDISVASLGNNLYFQRSYASASNNLSTSLSYGWTDNFETKIIGLPSPLTSITHPITLGLQTSNGSQLLFFHTISGAYAPDFGVTAQLSRTVNGNVVTYTITDKSQTIYTFNLNGLLTNKTDPAGHPTTYSYSGSNLLNQVIDVGSGRWLKFNYDGSNRVISVTDNISRSLGFTYNITGDLATMIDLRGLPWTYVYTGTHLLWKVIDPDLRTVIRTEYDSQGRAIQQFDGMNSKTIELNYGNGITTTLIDARGNPSIDTYAQGKWVNSMNAASGVIIRNYDLNFRPTYLADTNGNATQMRWSLDGANLEKIIYSPEISVGQVYSPALGITLTVYAAGISVTQKFDALNNLTQTTDARGFTTTYVYSGTFLTRKTDALLNTWIYTPTNDGRNLLAAEQAPGNRLTSYGYDQFGQRIVITDTANNLTRYQYDLIGRLISTTVNAGIYGLERTTLNRYDNAGKLISTTLNYTTSTNQPNYLGLYNLTTLYGYDGAGRQIAITDTIRRVNRNFYDGAGRLISTTVNVTTTDYSQNYLGLYNLITRYGYDAASNRILVTDTLGHVTKTDYDVLNRPITVTQNYSLTATTNDYNLRTTTGYDPAGNVISRTDALNHLTRTWYDTLNRPITVTTNYKNGVFDPAKPDEDIVRVTTYDFAGNGITSLDPLSRISKFGYDPLSRLISTTNALTGTTRYQFDGIGNRILVTDVLSRATRYEYDKLNRLITTTFPYTGWVVNTYDPAGNRTKVTDALGHFTIYTYDLQGRLIAQTDPVSGTTRYEYDVLGNRMAITDALGAVTRYAYDIAGHTLVVTQNCTTTAGLDPDTYNLITRYRYDVAGNLISMTNPISATSVYTYDALNRVVAQADALSRRWLYQYDTLGNRTVITDANSQITRFNYDAVNRLGTIVYPTGTVSYQYDAIGNRTVMTDLIGVSTFRYDALNRLTGHTDPFNQIITNTYDAYGNVIGLRYPDDKVVSYTYNANNWLINVRDWEGRVVTDTYDLIGRVTTSTLPSNVTTVFQYDAANRLIGLTTSNLGWTLGAYTYTLDALGNRINAYEYLSDLSFVEYLPIVMNNYSDTVDGGQGFAPQNNGGLNSTFTSPLAAPEADQLAPLFQSPLPTPPSNSQAVPIQEQASLLNLPESSASDNQFANALLTTFNSPMELPDECSGGLATFGETTVITYSYDPLHRLTAAAYSSGACFKYDYDAVSNMTKVTETITSTRVTAYTYDVTSRLATSKVDVESTTWYYHFDGNGNLIEMTPNGSSPGNGAIRYSYDAANQLNKIETYNDSYSTLAQMNYDGLGNRARMIAWAGGVPLTTTYATRIAGQVQILQVTSGANTITYLYGVTALGEFGSQSVYYLTDGAGSVRQLADLNGAVVLTRWYEPMGQILTQRGTSDATYGYLGAQVDRITGLLYINGAYYDPITGRFLSPNGNGQNPYVPLGGAALAPILILALLRRKKKGQIWTGWLVLAVMASVGLGVVACTSPNPTGPTPHPTPSRTSAPIMPSRTPTSIPSATPLPPTATQLMLPTPIPCPTPPPSTSTSGTAYITIDDGPGGYTSQVLDVLAKYNVKATFFLVGQNIQTHPDEVKRIKNEGHAIGIHSWSHPYWGQLSSEEQASEIEKTQAALEVAIGERSNLFRAPGGGTTTADISGLYNYNWTVDSFDYQYAQDTDANAQTVANNVFGGSSDPNLFAGYGYDADRIDQELAYTRNVAIDNARWSSPIILIHSIHPVDPPALDLIIQGLRNRGYSFGVLPRSGDSPGTGPITNGN